MVQDLSFDKRLRLVVGLLHMFAGMELLKGLWLAPKFMGVDTSLFWVVAISHAGVAVVTWVIATFCFRRRWSGVVGLGLVLVFYVLLALPRHRAMEMAPGWMAVLIIVQILLGLILLLAILLFMGNPEGKWSRWMATSSLRLRMVQWGLVPCLTLVMVEIGLRQIGMLPGVVEHSWDVNRVEALIPSFSYAAGEDGILVHSPSSRRRLHTLLAIPNDGALPASANDALTYDEKLLLDDYLALRQGRLPNAYSHYLDSIAVLPSAARDAIDSAYLQQVRAPINPQGFRSIPFQAYATAKRKVLLLGDSFTWGFSAAHFSTSFADLLIAKGFAVFNSGMPGVDPAQYAAVARRYIPVVRPDVVVVNLYMGNDILYFERPVEAYHPLLHFTNAGKIMAYPGPKWLSSAASAYAFVQEEFRIPASDSLLLNRVCSMTVIGTQVWKVLSAFKLIPFIRPNDVYWSQCAPQTDQPVTGNHLRSIQLLCKQFGTEFVLAVIPRFPEDTATLLARYPTVFAGLEPHIPNHLTDSDYEYRGGHFNDLGHRKYADMLAGILNN